MILILFFYIQFIQSQTCPLMYFYDPKEQTCKECSINCIKCNGTEYENCEICAPTFYKDDKTRICTNPLGCLEYEDHIGCTSCKENFKLIENKCSFQCEECQENHCSVNYCNKCINWFKSSDENGKCTIINGGKIGITIIFILMVCIIVITIIVLLSTFIFKIMKEKKEQQDDNHLII